MLSKALSHFPQFRFRDGQKRLWNPILKKTFVNRPEERVRLELVDYLILESRASSSRISFESPVNLPGDKSSSRTDIICYDSDFEPELLVECKATDVKLDEKAAVQIARYNQKVGAPLLLVSNGILDFWFMSKGEDIEALLEVPDIYESNQNLTLHRGYWTERGFLGTTLSPEAEEFSLNSCKKLFRDPHQPIKYLHIEDFNPVYGLSNYYRLFGFEGNIKLGLSLSANYEGETRLNAILNREGGNVAFSSVSMDKVAEGKPENAEIYSGRGVTKFNFIEEFSFNFEQDILSFVPAIRDFLNQHS